jgi:sugar lactone lactonase YvrE
MKRALIVLVVVIIGSMVLSGVFPFPYEPGPRARMAAEDLVMRAALPLVTNHARSDVQVIARGAPVHGANGLYFDHHDRLYIASVCGREVVVMNVETGAIYDRIGPERGVESPDDIAFGPDGSLYWAAIFSGEVGRLKPDGTKMTIAQGLMGVDPITFSDDGRLFVALEFMGMDGLFEIDPEGIIPPRAIISDVVGLNAFDFGPDGKLYGPLFFHGRLVRIDVDTAAMVTVAEGFTVPVAVKFDAAGRLFALDQAEGKVFTVNTTTGQKTLYATLEVGIDNLAFNSQGRLFVSNNNTGAIVEVYANGNHRVVSPGGMTAVDGMAVLPRADGESVYVATVFGVIEFDGATGQQRGFAHAVIGASPLLMPQTVAAAGNELVTSSWFENAVQVWNPVSNTISVEYTDVALPLNAIRFQGDIVVAELGNGRVMRISAADRNVRTTLATLPVPTGLAATAQDLWAADWATGRVVQIFRNGVQLSPPAVVASGLWGPEGMAVAPDGSLLVVEALAGRLLRIDPTDGAISVLAAGLETGLAGPSTMPPIWIFDGVAVGPSGTIYIGGNRGFVLYRTP